MSIAPLDVLYVRVHIDVWDAAVSRWVTLISADRREHG